MDANFINPVLRSTLNIFSTMVHISPKVGSPKIKKQNEITPGKNITGVMSMIGKRGNASIAITFSEAAILQIAKNMLPGVEITKIDGMVIDLVGELANMALGGAKNELEAGDYFFKLSLPTIILGSDYLVAHKTNAPIIILPFTLPENGGEFFVEAGYEASSVKHVD
jgi:chemotaxis protein CheX